MRMGQEMEMRGCWCYGSCRRRGSRVRPFLTLSSSCCAAFAFLEMSNVNTLDWMLDALAFRLFIHGVPL